MCHRVDLVKMPTFVSVRSSSADATIARLRGTTKYNRSAEGFHSDTKKPVPMLKIILLCSALLISSNIRGAYAAAGQSSYEGQAAEVLRNMNPSVDPCVDFYEFACGSWNKTATVPPDAGVYSIYDQKEVKMNLKIKELLENRTGNEKEPKSIKNAKKFYASCMDTESIERYNITTLMNGIFAELGQWPMVSKRWRSYSFDLEGTLAKFRLIGFEFLWTSKVRHVNRFDTVIEVGKPQLTLSLPGLYILRNNVTLPNYANFVKNMTLQYDGKLNQNSLSKDIQDMIAFEKKLAQLSLKSDILSSVWPLTTTLENMGASITGQINWIRYMTGVFESVGKSIQPTQQVVVNDLPYFQKLGDILRETKSRTLANYLMSRLMINLVRHMPRKLRGNMRLEVFNKEQTVSGTLHQTERWHFCVDNVNQCMPDAVARLYVDDDSREMNKADVLEMIRNTTEIFKQTIDAVSWMNQEERQAYRAKIDALTADVGYPDYIKNDTLLDAQYGYLGDLDDSYFESVMSCLSLTAHKYLGKLGEPASNHVWDFAPISLMAWTMERKNQIALATGFAQSPFYSKDRLRALNFGSVGVVIGHELMHGFGDEAHTSGRSGARESSWTEETLGSFHEVQSCIKGQYGAYSVTKYGLKLKATRTINEDVADNGAVELAFKAYKLWTSANGVEQPLPGLGYTTDQLFFISYGQTWCGTYKDDFFSRYILLATHSPHKYRAIGPISNSRDFSQAFKCPAGAPMNPINKCRIW